jgi:beta-1,4-N-acetylglucosaminyltransferase
VDLHHLPGGELGRRRSKRAAPSVRRPARVAAVEFRLASSLRIMRKFKVRQFQGRSRPTDNMKVALIASSGGHIYEMFCLKGFWETKERFWVTFKTSDAEYLLRDEKTVFWAAHPTVRNIKNLIKNLFLSWRVLRTMRPDVILTTGAGVAAPFLWIGRLLGIRTVFVESITRITELSLTAKLVYPVVDRLLVQWEELAEKYSKAQYHGRII